MNSKILAAITVLLACLLPVSLAADKEYTTLTVAVMDAVKDRPVPKAAVTVHFVSGRRMLRMKKVRAEWNTKTNNKGLAELPEMPSGRVRLQVIAPGFQTYGDEFEISGKEQTVTVKLKRPSDKQVSAHEAPEPAPEPAAVKKKPE